MTKLTIANAGLSLPRIGLRTSYSFCDSQTVPDIIIFYTKAQTNEALVATLTEKLWGSKENSPQTTELIDTIKLVVRRQSWNAEE